MVFDKMVFDKMVFNKLVPLFGVFCFVVIVQCSNEGSNSDRVDRLGAPLPFNEQIGDQSNANGVMPFSICSCGWGACVPAPGYTGSWTCGDGYAYHCCGGK
ncbi:unnamed protein product, partial [Mesorhabditis belari]|uniref:Uncharacterized protein n=1 Tax=Mesorhabditis belari TaxID=2138241 RepID=A0AAF3F683_9BILA